MMHVPEGANIDAKRKMLRKINDAIVEAYHLPKFMIFMQEYSLDRVALDGGLHSDNKARVEAQKEVYRDEGAEQNERPG
jgi:hypothetical protein